MFQPLVLLFWTFLLGTACLQAASPHAGTYQGDIKFYDGTTPTGVPYSITPMDFTIEESGVVTNVVAGSILTSTIQGTVTDAGVATFTIAGGPASGTKLVSGTVAAGVFTATVPVAAFPGHSSSNQILSATRVYGVIPIWQTSTSAAALVPSGNYNFSLAASPTTFVGLVSPISGTTGWSTLTSTDGATWIKTPLDLQSGLANTSVSAYASPIAYLNGHFIFSVNISTTTTRVYTSTDGVSWTMSSTGISNLYVLTWGYFNGSYAGLLLRSDGTSLRALTSPDATTWTLRTLGSGLTQDPAAFAASPTRALASISGNVGLNGISVFSGTDFTTAWTGAAFPDGGFYGAAPLLYGNGSFLASGAKMMLSPDGLAWTAVIPGPPNTADDINSGTPLSNGIFASGSFYGLSSVNSGLFLRSTNGQAWSRAVRPPANVTFQWDANNIAVANGVAVTSAYLNGLSAGRAFLYATLETGPGLPSVRAPSITSEPGNQTSLAGAAFTLTGTFKGNGLLMTYQWFKDGQLLSGKTDRTLFLASPVVGDTGTYTLVATNAVGSTSSRAVAVSVTLPPAPVLSSFPSSQYVPEGNTGVAYSLSVSASGTGLTYQWRLAGNPISGKTTASLTLTSVPASSGVYDCVITNAGGTVTTPPAQITFLPAAAPVIVSKPNYLVYAPAATAFCSAGVSGTGPYGYQWFKDGTPLAEASPAVTGTATSQIILTPAQAGSFRCQVTTPNGILLGPPTVITIAEPPANNLLGKPLVKIADHNTLRPDAPTLKLGLINSVRFRDDTVLFTARATTSNTYLYRWKDGVITAIASDTTPGLNGQVFTGVSGLATEPSSGSFFFVGNHTVATVATTTLYRWSGGTLTPLLSKDDPAPDGNGVINSLGATNMAARDDVLFFNASIKLPNASTENRIYRRGADGVISLVIGPSTTLPGTAFLFSFVTGQFSYDGTTLLMPLYDKANTGALFHRTNDGTLTRLYDQFTPLPLTSAKFTLPGVADVEGGRIFAASTNYFEASLNPDGTILSANPVGRTVTACGPDSFLSYTTRGVFFRKDSLTLTVVDPIQNVDSFVPSLLSAEAHGTEAAILAVGTSATSLFVALDLPASAAPVITYQPAPRTSDSGSTVTFTALASGEALSWQWFKNTDPIPGATFNTLTLSNLSPADNATYKATATNTVNSATSNPAALTVSDTATHVPTFFLQPADQTILLGKNTFMNYVADPGASTFTYLWTKNGAPFSNLGSMNFVPAAATDAGTYQLTITNSAGSATSRLVTVSLYDPNPVVPPFVIKAAALAGNAFTFSTPALTSGKTYQLQSSPTLVNPVWSVLQTIPGNGSAQSLNLTINPADTSGFYRVVEMP